jgi:hypothetical protein
MTHKRVVRVICYEGNADWVDETLARSPLAGKLKTLFRKQGTVRELYRVELGDDGATLKDATHRS